ncbi:MAG: LysM peptidoglycan-binding domain-containing protein [Anaerolineae bacterium]|nr:LysM peptidoglycan-binding domain-containing protein [Anaerolineae bacterium]
MNKCQMKRVVLLVCAGCLMALAWFPLHAQENNLLQNPGFEAPFNTMDGDPPRQVAQGWTPWHIPAAPDAPSYANRQPEYEPAAPDTSRIMEGSDAQRISSFFATHDGGVYQRVTGVAPGTPLQFSVYAYVWSTTFDNVDSSEENGDVFVQVGIDPTGGTDPESTVIAWSPAGVEQYDAYNEYTVSAEAAGDAVSVFVRTIIDVPVKNNDIYLDQAALTASGEATEEPEATETVEPTAEEATATDTLEPTATETTSVDPLALTATAVIAQTTETAAAALTETASAPEATATEDNVALTTTAIVAGATETTAVELTETASVPEATATEDPLMFTATAIIAQATETAAVALTETASAPEATATEDTAALTATAIVAEATETAAVAMTETASVPETTATEDPLFLTATAIIEDATTTAEANLTATAGAIVEASPTATETPTSAPITDQFPSTINHTVQQGETVAILAERYGSTVEAIVEANGLDDSYLIRVGQGLVIPVRLPAPATATQPSVVVVTATPSSPVPPLGSSSTYIVRAGDTLSRIARLFNTNVAALAQLNGIVNVDRIQVGQQLRLPTEPTSPSPQVTPTHIPTQAPTPAPQAVYIVRPGDSLYKISLTYGVSIAQIVQANNINNVNRIYVGQTLIIP